MVRGRSVAVHAYRATGDRAHLDVLRQDGLPGLVHALTMERATGEEQWRVKVDAWLGRAGDVVSHTLATLAERVVELQGMYPPDATIRHDRAMLEVLIAGELVAYLGLASMEIVEVSPPVGTEAYTEWMSARRPKP